MTYYLLLKTGTVFSVSVLVIGDSYLTVFGLTNFHHIPLIIPKGSVPSIIFLPINFREAMTYSFLDLVQQFVGYNTLLFMTRVFTSFFQALKLSDELNLNEIECVRLLVDANREV